MDEFIEKEDKVPAEESGKDIDKNPEEQLLNVKDGISVYEGKMLVFILGAIITLVFSLVMYFSRNDISDNLTYIVITFICAIAGISSLEQVIDGIKSKFKK